MKSFTRNFIYFAIIVTNISCTGINLIRGDLDGKPLVADDFKFIYKNNLMPVFITEKEIDDYYHGYKTTETNDFQYAYSLRGPRTVNGLETKEFTNGDVRVVFKKDFVIKNNYKNGYLGITKNAMTLRGITIGDSINKVFEKYGENDFANKHKDVWQTEFMSFSYRYYYPGANVDMEYPLYDRLMFEIDYGKVVGIDFDYKLSDAP